MWSRKEKLIAVACEAHIKGVKEVVAEVCAFSKAEDALVMVLRGRRGRRV